MTLPHIIPALCLAALSLVPGSFDRTRTNARFGSSRSTPEASPESAAQTVFRVQDLKGYASVRIPVLISGRNGRMLAFAEGRKVAEDQGMCDIILSRSDDGGRSWSKPATIAKSGEDTFNNACPVLDATTGAIFVLFQRYPKGTTERNGKALAGLEAADRVVSNHLIVSKDNGDTWSNPVDITRTTKAPEITLFAGGPNAGVQLTRGPWKGRLVVSYNQSVGFGTWSAYAVYSDDHGTTWKMGHAAPGQLGWANETAIAETDEGGLYLNARKWRGAALRKVAWSSNGGADWTRLEEESSLVCTGTQGCLLKYSFANDLGEGGKTRMLYAGSTEGRAKGKVFLSYNDGKNWQIGRIAIPGEYAYSSMAKLPDGRIGLLFEPGGEREIRFTTFSIDWLTDSRDKGR